MEHAQPTKRKMLRVTLAGVFGTTLEFYDHFIYGSAAALVFPHVFFVQMSPSLALLLSLVTYSVAFVARPLGAVVFGHFGDRYGRKNVLIAALLMMGVSTFLIGCLPSYAIAGSFGATALCFLRLFQGIALGGEWGGAALIVNEYARDSKAKGLLGSVVQVASPVGLLLASASFALLTDFTPPDFLLAGGWRIPFLASALLVLTGLYVRRGVDESPAFLEQDRSQQAAPIVEVFKHHLKPVLLGIGTRVGSDTAFYVFTLFPLVYLPRLGVAEEVASMVGVFAALGQIVGTPVFGYCCDKWGTKKVLLAGAVSNLVYGFAYFWLLDTTSTPVILAGAFVALFLLSMAWAPLAAHLPALFPVEVRYTATSVSFQAAGIFGGALAPSICLLLLDSTASGMVIAAYLGVTLVLAFFCTLKSNPR